MKLRNPRTGEHDEAIETTSGPALVAAVERLRVAQPGWAAQGVEARAAELLAWAARIGDVRDDLLAELVADTGRLRESAMEVDAVIGMLHRWAGLGPSLLADEAPRDASVPGFSVRQGHEAFPLVGVISPWNFPLLLSMIDTIPALVAGCAVLVKPSEVTPRFTRALEATLPTCVALAVGNGAVGAALVDHVDLVCFTGSVPTGQRVAAQAAANFIPAFLELGGKDPAVILPGTDLERTARAVLWGATSNAGQACQSIERVYVHTSEHDEFVAVLASLASDLGLAWPNVEDPGLGPIIAADQVHVIEAHLADAVQRGATALTGGEIEHHGGGAWLRPTVLAGVNHHMRCMVEETFGPIIPVMAYSTVDEAVNLANDTTYGLSAAVFAPDPDEARAVGRRIRAGAVSINDCSLTALVHDAEKQSFGLSGMGASRMGPAALTRFGRRTALIENDALTSDPWWWPTP